MKELDFESKSGSIQVDREKKRMTARMFSKLVRSDRTELVEILSRCTVFVRCRRRFLRYES